jgi:hypothetical protein
MQKLKVNDRRGNPVEIAAVVVWRVKDTAQAVFDVDDFERYVDTQSETALRHLASSYAYDHGEENEITLRSNVDEVSQALKTEPDERLPLAEWWSKRPGSPAYALRSPRPCPPPAGQRSSTRQKIVRRGQHGRHGRGAGRKKAWSRLEPRQPWSAT